MANGILTDQGRSRTKVQLYVLGCVDPEPTGEQCDLPVPCVQAQANVRFGQRPHSQTLCVHERSPDEDAKDLWKQLEPVYRVCTVLD